MTEVLCGVCHTNAKKYKCPTCSLPYCSLSCFKIHKPTHPVSEPSPSPSQPPLEIPQPPPPTPLPKYLRKRTDFSTLATNPNFQELLKTHTGLLAALQKVYAATIESDPREQKPRARGGRGWGQGRGRGRGYGGRGRFGGHGGDAHDEPKWTPARGDRDGMRWLKRFREGNCTADEEVAMAEFGKLLDELYGEKDKKGSGEEVEMT